MSDMDKLQIILDKHKKWLNDEPGGEQADLQDVYLKWADLRRADLRWANLRGANLYGAYLQEANLQGANLDYSCWPLWCGSQGVKVDRKIAAQLAAHFCVLDCDDPDYLAARKAVLQFAMSSHRAEDLGLKGGGK